MAALSFPSFNSSDSEADIAEGTRHYIARRAVCHDPNGECGRGPTLSAGNFQHAGTDREIFMSVRYCVPNTEMPPFYNPTKEEIWRIVAFVKQSSRRGSAAESAGDPSAGQAGYASKGGVACHVIDRQGGHLGPDLSNAGSRSAAYLEESIVNPGALSRSSSARRSRPALHVKWISRLWPSVGIGRRTGLKIRRTSLCVWVQVPPRPPSSVIRVRHIA
jgi:hypothetical protein